jgi:hypothetical protein
MILECTYDRCSKQYEAIDGLPLPWQSGTESMLTGFHERFNPHGIRNAAPRSLSMPLRAETAERLKLKK